MFDAVIPAQAGIALFFLEKRPSPALLAPSWRSPFGPASLFAGAPAPAVGILSPHCGEREWISNAR
jgi:hypothetical protein